MWGSTTMPTASLNSQLAVPVQPGRYMLAVRQFSPDYQGVIRIASAGNVPATQ